jgi:peroxiredoxin
LSYDREAEGAETEGGEEAMSDTANTVGIPHEHLKLTRAMQLPTFETSGMTLLKRLTMVIDNGTLRHVFYPVFPQDESAKDVIRWLSVKA